MKSGQSTVKPLKTGQWTSDKHSSFMLDVRRKKRKGREEDILIYNSGLTNFGQAGHKYPECNDIRVLYVIPSERDDRKALRMAVICRASRASLS